MSVLSAGKVQRLSRRFWIVLSSFLASLLFLLFQGGKFASMTFIIVFILCVYILLGRWSGISQARGTRAVSGGAEEGELRAGDTLQVKLDVQIPGYWPISYLIIKDYLIHKTRGEMTFETTLIPDWKRSGSVEYRTLPLRRGFYRFGKSECSTGDIFGVFEHTGPLDLPISFRILPQTIEIKEWNQMHRMMKGMHHHSATTRALRETTQINGVREYNYGDRLSRIHWNATARTGTWKSKEFERESMPKTIIVLDRQQTDAGKEEEFELAVSTAASLVQYGIQRSMSLGLLSVGREAVYFEPKNGIVQHNEILNHLIDAEANGTHSLLQILEERSRILVPGSFIVIVSSRKGDDILKVLGWMRQKQLNPCHLVIGEDRDDHTSWINLLRTQGILAYSVGSLAELPKRLGGRA